MRKEILSPLEWGARKRKLWDTIHYFISMNKEVLNNEANKYIDEIEELHKIEKLISNYLKKNTNLLIFNRIGGQTKTISDFTKQYIIAIWLMSQEIPVERNIIKEMSELDYKIINQIADHLKVILPKAKTGKRIDAYLLQRILCEIQYEIHRYSLGLDPASLSKLGNKLGVNQSVISYWGEKNYPKEYVEIWGRDEDWYISDQVRSFIIERFNEEIDKYNDGQAPASLSSVAKEFSEDTCYSTVRKIVVEEFPNYYILIWKSDCRLSTENKKLLYKKLNTEIEKKNPASLSEIGRALDISYDIVRYYAKKRYPNLFDEIWEKSRLTEQEIEAIQDRYQQEIEKFEKYEKKTIIYDEFSQKFDITKNDAYKPISITGIANEFNRSDDTISRIFTKTDPKKYDEIYAKPRLTEDQLESIISDILYTMMPQTGLAEKHNVSVGTISKISLEKIQPNYNNYIHSERFPHDIYQQLGVAIHSIIQCISTKHLLKNKIYKFSEIPDRDYVIDDLLPCTELKKFYHLIYIYKDRLSLWEKIGFDFDNYNEIVFEYTSYISEEQFQKKVKKYYKLNRMIFIIGTRWYDKKYPNPIIHTRFKNVKIIRHDIFADLIGLAGDLRKEFDNAIELNYNYDLEGMNALKDEITKKYPKLGFTEYKKYCKKTATF